MSLRTFHLLFISLSAIMCVASAGLIGFLASEEPWAIPGIIMALLGSVGLFVYGRSFLRKYGSILPKG